MKKAKLVIVLLLLIISVINASAQATADTSKTKTFIVVKNDGREFVGKIISQDAREVLIETKNIGQVMIPKHEIKEIRVISEEEITKKGDYKPNETFATRYFLTTNGFPIKKGESYIIWNWFGPDMQFGVAKNFGLGIISSWTGMPVIGTAKYSIRLDENTHIALGALAGTGSWAFPDFGFALPFASMTYGNRRNNLTFSGGYGSVWGNGASGGRVIVSVAAMAKLTTKATFVFDSFIMPPTSGRNEFLLIMPGIRLQTQFNKAFQIGFAGINTGSGYVPIPMIQFFRML